MAWAAVLFDHSTREMPKHLLHKSIRFADAQWLNHAVSHIKTIFWLYASIGRKFCKDLADPP